MPAIVPSVRDEPDAGVEGVEIVLEGLAVGAFLRGRRGREAGERERCDESERAKRL